MYPGIYAAPYGFTLQESVQPADVIGPTHFPTLRRRMPYSPPSRRGFQPSTSLWMQPQGQQARTDTQMAPWGPNGESAAQAAAAPAPATTPATVAAEPVAAFPWGLVLLGLLGVLVVGGGVFFVARRKRAA